MISTTLVGDGPRKLLLLHGFLGSGRNLTSFARRWVQADPSLSILLPDLPGHGTSLALEETDNLKDIAEKTLAAARAEGFEGKLDWVGHSFGGRIALAAALAVPEAVGSITLLDITPSPIEGRSESAHIVHELAQAPESAANRDELRQFFLGRGMSPGITEWLLMNLVHTDAGYTWRIDRQALQRLHERVNRADLWEAVERPVAPVRCVRAERARYVTDEDAERMRRAGCPVHTLTVAGHFVHVDAPDRLLDLLLGKAPW